MTWSSALRQETLTGISLGRRGDKIYRGTDATDRIEVSL